MLIKECSLIRLEKMRENHCLTLNNSNEFSRVCSAASLHMSLVMKAKRVDAEWQAKRCVSCGQRRSMARTSVAKMRKGESGRETSPSGPCDWVMRDTISRVCQLEDKLRGYWWKRKGGTLCTMGCVQERKLRMLVWVCHGMAEIQSTAVGRGVLWK